MRWTYSYELNRVFGFSDSRLIDLHFAVSASSPNSSADFRYFFFPPRPGNLGQMKIRHLQRKSFQKLENWKGTAMAYAAKAGVCRHRKLPPFNPGPGAVHGTFPALKKRRRRIRENRRAVFAIGDLRASIGVPGPGPRACTLKPPLIPARPRKTQHTATYLLATSPTSAGRSRRQGHRPLARRNNGNLLPGVQRHSKPGDWAAENFSAILVPARRNPAASPSAIETIGPPAENENFIKPPAEESHPVFCAAISNSPNFQDHPPDGPRPCGAPKAQAPFPRSSRGILGPHFAPFPCQ